MRLWVICIGLLIITGLVVISMNISYLRFEQELQERNIMEEPWKLRPSGFRSEIASVADWLWLRFSSLLMNLLTVILITLLVKGIFAIPGFPIKGSVLPVLGVVILAFITLVHAKIIDLGPFSRLIQWATGPEAMVAGITLVVPVKRILFKKKKKGAKGKQ